MNLAAYPTAASIVERRSIKQFTEEPVSTELLYELLNIAVWAPNHGLREPWRFILFIEEGKRILGEAIAKHAVKIRKPQTYIDIPAHLLVVINEDQRQRESEEDFAAACTLIQNFQLAAWERGLGVIWKTEPYTFNPNFRSDVGIQPGEKLVGLLHIGYPKVIPAAKPRTSAETKLTIISSTTTEDSHFDDTITAGYE
ncbi:putative NAD(P)H nitroreductase YdjA [compost metagenome]